MKVDKFIFLVAIIILSAKLRMLADVVMGHAESKLVETKTKTYVTCLPDVKKRKGIVKG